MGLGWVRWRARAPWSPVAPRHFCVAGVALGDIHRRFTWQVWHLATSIVVLRGHRGTNGTGLGQVACLGAVGRPWRRGTFAWQAWPLATPTVVSLGRCGTWRHRSSFCVARVGLFAHATHTPSLSHNFVTHNLSHTTLSQTICHFHTPSVTHTDTHTHTSLSRTCLSHTIFHTHLCHTPSFTHTHTHLCHTPSVTHISSSAAPLLHTHTPFTHPLSHTIFHTPPFPHHLGHTPSWSHTIFHTPSLSHTSLSHTIFHTISVTQIFVTHRLSHTTCHTTTLSRTIFHACFTLQLHTTSFTHNLSRYYFVTHHLSHIFHTTTLSHTIVHTHHLSRTTLSHATLSTHTHTQIFTYKCLSATSSTTSFDSFVYPSFPIPVELLFLLIGRN